MGEGNTSTKEILKENDKNKLWGDKSYFSWVQSKSIVKNLYEIILIEDFFELHKKFQALLENYEPTLEKED